MPDKTSVSLTQPDEAVRPIPSSPANSLVIGQPFTVTSSNAVALHFK